MANRKLIRQHMKITGRVQGVGFRYRARYAASNLGVTEVWRWKRRGRSIRLIRC